VPAPDWSGLWRSSAALAVLLLGVAPALAYVGPGAGLEFTDSFLSLLAWMGVALCAALLWPFHALLRRLLRSKETSTAGPPGEAGPTNP
jgi:hypothetical protein